jgi:hypothetical protein
MSSNASGRPRAELGGQVASPGSQAFMPGMWRRPRRPLVDRVSERAGIDDLLGLVRRGMSGVLVLRGGPGVGKDHPG